MQNTETLTLAEFLLARIAEDEAVARATRDRAWSASMGLQVRGASGTVACWDCCGGSPSASEPEQEHIARHDPSRVLAECEAKRRIVDWAFANAEQIDSEWGDACLEDDLRAGHCETYGAQAVDELLTKLALPYANHPDYREEWRP